jgi:hypothetical protein
MDEIKKDVVPSNKSTVIQIIFLILLLAAISGLFIATITIYKYKDMLSNPLGYNLEKFKIDSCNCWSEDGKAMFITSTKYNKNNSKLNYHTIP